MRSLRSFWFAWVNSGAPSGHQTHLGSAWVHSVEHTGCRVNLSSRKFTPARLGVVGFIQVLIGSLSLARECSGLLGSRRFTHVLLGVAGLIGFRVVSLRYS